VPEVGPWKECELERPEGVEKATRPAREEKLENEV